MVAAPETKTTSEVVASKDVEKPHPTTEEIKKSNVDSEKPVEDVKSVESKSEEPEATGSKDVTDEPDSSKLEKAAEKLSAGKKALLQNLPQQAVDHLAEACELQSSVQGDMSDTMCEFYYYYGRALLDLARIEGDVLGNALTGVPDGDDLENSQVEDPEKLTEEDKESEDAEEGDEMEEGEEETEGETTQEESQDEDDVPSLQLAWEVLELAKTIYQKRENKSEDEILKLSQVFLKLGEVSLENENYNESINMYAECLKLQESVLPSDDRWLAETHYQLGLAHSLADNFDEAVKHLKDAIAVIEARIKTVTEKLEKDSVKVTTDMETSNLSPEQKSWANDVKELKKLLPELQEKMTDIRDTKASFTEKLKAMKAHFSGQLSGGSSGKSAFEDGASTSGFGATSESADSKGAKPIATTLIRKKRKPEEEAEPAEDAKKPRTEITKDATEDKTKDATEDKTKDTAGKVNGTKTLSEDSTKPDKKEEKETEEEKMETEESEVKESE